jgi:adenosylcobinamide amidohydrolase
MIALFRAPCMPARTPARPGARPALAPPLDVALDVSGTPRWLIARFATEHATASWAIVGGGVRMARAVAWLQVRDAELGPAVDAAELLRDRLAATGLAGAVGLMTTRRLDRYVDITARHGELAARCIATVGLGNALRAGDPPGPSRLGTINLLCRLSVPLSPGAQLEALALAAEARTLAVREAQVPSARTGLPASGTGTDCIVIAAPRGAGAAYAGKHTAIGHVIGAAVHEATRRGVEQSLEERRAAARQAGEARR